MTWIRPGTQAGLQSRLGARRHRQGRDHPIQPLMIDTGYVGSKDKEWRGRSEHPARTPSPCSPRNSRRPASRSQDPQPADATDDDAQTGDEAKPTELAEVESATISEIVEYALVHSDNVVAEVLGNEVAIAQGEPGSLEAGPQAVLDALSDTVDLGQTHLEDTSGLSYDNQISPHDLTTILQASVVADDSLSDLIAAMPVGGLTGTLTDRFTKDRNAAGAVHAKTGTLSTVTSLAGGCLMPMDAISSSPCRSTTWTRTKYWKPGRPWTTSSQHSRIAAADDRR